jgi:hypothetical protein
MLGAFTQFETNLRRESQLEGISAAKARGVYAASTRAESRRSTPLKSCDCAGRNSSARQQSRAGSASAGGAFIACLASRLRSRQTGGPDADQAGDAGILPQRPHGVTVRCLPNGRWFDATRRTWRNVRAGQPDGPIFGGRPCRTFPKRALRVSERTHLHPRRAPGIWRSVG